MKRSVLLFALFMALSCAKEENIEPLIIQEDVVSEESDDEESDDETESNTPPEKATLVNPANNELVATFLDIVLEWTGEDLDGDELSYTLFFGQDPTALEVILEDTFEPNTTLERLVPGEQYYWQIESIDGSGASSLSDLKSFTIYEKVYEGNYSISEASDALTFSNEGYTRVKGNLIIDGQDIDLTKLNSLHHIQGQLLISNTNSFNLEGLENVLEIEWLWIKDNPLLQNIKALENSYVSQNFSLSFNDVLSSIGEIKVSDELEWLVLEGNPALRDLSNFKTVTRINQGMILFGCESLTDLQDFSGLEYIGDFLTLESNNNLQSLDGLNNLKTIEREALNIWNHQKLTHIDALSNLTRCGEFLNIGVNASLTEVNLPNLNEVDKSIEIVANTSLKIVSGFNELKTTPGVFVNQNDQLEIITGFNKSVLLGDVTISLNPSLTEIKGFENLESTNIRITDNGKLSNFCTFSNAALKALEERKEFSIIGNAYNPTTQMIADGNQCKN